MTAFYIVTKGEHPFGEKPDRLRNLLDGKPVGLDTLKDPVLKDLLSRMLSHDPNDRPSAAEALKHPYLKEYFTKGTVCAYTCSYAFNQGWVVAK
jgi:serine/threonine protein kinase